MPACLLRACFSVYTRRKLFLTIHPTVREGLITQHGYVDTAVLMALAHAVAPKKQTKMSLNDFLADQTKGSWADDTEELPSAPSADSTLGRYERQGSSNYGRESGGGGFGGDRGSGERFGNDRGPRGVLVSLWIY